MPHNRFVRPETVRLDLSDGDWLVVKKHLTAGEERAQFARMYHATTADGITRVNPLQVGIALCVAYLIDWSFADDAGKIEIARQPIEVVEGALNNLFPDEFAEVREAIEAHERRMIAARTEEKKRRNGSTASAPISESPAAVAGVTNGSEILTLTSIGS